MIDADRPLETVLLRPTTTPAQTPRPYAERIAIPDGIVPPTTGLADFPPADAVIQEHLLACAGLIRVAHGAILRLVMTNDIAAAVDRLMAILHEAIEETGHAAAALRLQAMAREAAPADPSPPAAKGDPDRRDAPGSALRPANEACADV